MSQIPGSPAKRDGTAMSPASPMMNENQPNCATRWIRRILFGLFAAQCLLVWTRLWLTQRPFKSARWPEGLLLVLAAATTVVTLAKELPWQNVLLASAIIIFVSVVTQGLTTLVGASFGSSMDPEAKWSGPLIWLVAILNARGVARLVIARWRTCRFYGSWLIGVTAVLVGFFGLGLRYLDAAAADLHLHRQAEEAGFRPETAPSLSLLWWTVAALPALVLATPSLTNKRPVEPPLPRQPLICWLLLNFLFASAAALQGRWAEAALVAVGNLVAVVLAFSRTRAHDCPVA